MKIFDKLYDEARKYPITHIAVWQDGEYRQETLSPSDPFANLYSVSKSFTATAVGILIDRGMLRLSDTVSELLATVCKMPEEWAQVTLRDVMNHQVGNGGMFLDMDCDNVFEYASNDYLSIVLNRTFHDEPGTVFQYSDANYYLVSRIVSAVTGETLQAFLGRELFTPLKIQGWAWSCCPQGYAMGATKLYMDIEGMINFGRLYLDYGMFDRKQIISKDWAQAVSQTEVQATNGRHYSLGFWRKDGKRAFYCGGMLGQRILIDRERNSVIAVQAADAQGNVEKVMLLLDS